MKLGKGSFLPAGVIALILVVPMISSPAAYIDPACGTRSASLEVCRSGLAMVWRHPSRGLAARIRSGIREGCRARELPGRSAVRTSEAA